MIRQIIARSAAPTASRYVLLDRDGVINRDRADYVKSPDECIEIDGAGDAIQLLNRLGFRVLVMSNQACVSKGIITLEQLLKINEHLARLIGVSGGMIDAFYCCPHSDSSCCDCRKPAPGLLIAARDDYNFDPADTCFVGDSPRDAQAAVAAGCQPVLVRTGKVWPEGWTDGFQTHASLLEFARHQARLTEVPHAL